MRGKAVESRTRTPRCSTLSSQAVQLFAQIDPAMLVRCQNSNVTLPRFLKTELYPPTKYIEQLLCFRHARDVCYLFYNVHMKGDAGLPLHRIQLYTSLKPNSYRASLNSSKHSSQWVHDVEMAWQYGSFA